MAHIVIVGSGIAGLFAAAKLADANHNVTVITKQRTKDSSTNWAQGGIAAILDKTNHDGMEAHVQDTLRSGDGLCNEAVVRSIIQEAGERISDLIDIGVHFEQRNDGSFSLAKEGGHSESRILHAKDATGKEIERALTQYAEGHANITLLPNTLAIDLIQRRHGVDEHGIAGVWCLDQISNEVLTVEADAIMLATGGVGRLWKATTNPTVATGDGLAMAYRAGACVQDLAFIQFHPTSLFAKSNRPFLMSEALRGEGAVLLDHEGYEQWKAACERAEKSSIEAPKPNSYSFTLKHSSEGSMATRDIVARAIDQCLKTTGKSHVFLVTSHLDSKALQQHFPNIQRRLTQEGITLGMDPIPVVPAAHYMVGGIKVDNIGRAFVRDSLEIMPHLYAIGEVACTGMHGANRLASNSLLEAVVYAHRASDHLINNPPPKYQGSHPQWRAEGLASLREHAPIMHDRNSLLTTMDQEVGIVRTNQRLERASRRLELFHDEIDLLWRECLPSRELIELRNLSLIGTLVVEDALLQTSNTGLHFNLDLKKDDRPQ
ncbi:FAD-dependent oxidoreductase [Candidatus Poseidonia alphae]|nr:FAD-dependent oxidoreductase [Candidatus Poseidonia alphae]MDA8758856.1 FAD-dependent oxidoreductase [Candidatus Poseidonia alphae]MDB2569364.1 FAD-dependent oxidoreductase [Candidatus Poseidonia alphae]MDC0626023.1 FAD-dependent oxidoreductase [Candidatus Poseidonia alphae]